MDTPIYYAPHGRDDAFGDGWQDIQVWREAVAEWRLARERYDADPASDAAYHRLRAAEARIAELRDVVVQERMALEAIDWDEAERRLIAAYDATGRWLHRLAWALAAIAVVGWWWAWR